MLSKSKSWLDLDINLDFRFPSHFIICHIAPPPPPPTHTHTFFLFYPFQLLIWEECGTFGTCCTLFNTIHILVNYAHNYVSCVSLRIMIITWSDLLPEHIRSILI